MYKPRRKLFTSGSLQGSHLEPGTGEYLLLLCSPTTLVFPITMFPTFAVLDSFSFSSPTSKGSRLIAELFFFNLIYIFFLILDSAGLFGLTSSSWLLGSPHVLSPMPLTS
ncbi:hypothetical protein CIPAW_08G163300 [Carya illinoinensis]|uniref:Uncharacterized protein n=1 Tax=Carya illinoinensis TaxID=32201 RepID=A0A8T1PW04_CARIL|nr:hypothetical protein CIPAW_08G163300 [Carya illinoinensis]